MVIREYPKEIKELMKIYEPYMVGCHLENAPPEAIEAFKKYGVIKGMFLTIKRILKCHPFHPGGYDPLK